VFLAKIPVFWDKIPVLYKKWDGKKPYAIRVFKGSVPVSQFFHYIYMKSVYLYNLIVRIEKLGNWDKKIFEKKGGM
jgi:hypothetical protein